MLQLTTVIIPLRIKRKLQNEAKPFNPCYLERRLDTTTTLMIT
jgi:hypothetical protein